MKRTSVKHAGLVAALLMGTIVPAAAAVPAIHYRTAGQAAIASGATLPDYGRYNLYEDARRPLTTPDGRITSAGAAYERARSHESICQHTRTWPGC